MGDVALGEMRQESACCPGREEKFAKDLDLNQALGYILKKKIGGRTESAPGSKCETAYCGGINFYHMRICMETVWKILELVLPVLVMIFIGQLSKLRGSISQETVNGMKNLICNYFFAGSRCSIRSPRWSFRCRCCSSCWSGWS